MNFIHTDEVIQKYPNNYTGAILVKNFSDYAKLSTGLEYVKTDILSEDFLANVRPKANEWQAIFSQMGAKPSYQCSLAKLIEVFERQKSLYTIHPIVDFYNYYSLVNGVPMAAYDADKINGDLRLGLLGKGRDFIPLGLKNAEKTKDKEIGYFDDEKIICRYWNKQDCDQTKITENVSNILFIFDLLFEESTMATSSFSKICKDFSNTFYENGKELDFAGMTGPGMPNTLTFSL